MMHLEGSPPSDVVHIHVRLPRRSRAEVHFHFEASDGMGYLEQGAEPELGIVHTPPDFVDEVIDWLTAMGPGLQVEVLGMSTEQQG